MRRRGSCENKPDPRADWGSHNRRSGIPSNTHGLSVRQVDAIGGRGMSRSHHNRDERFATPSLDGAPQGWSWLYLHAVKRLWERLSVAGELPAGEVARAVIAMIPLPWRRQVRAEFRRRGWLQRGALVPCDALELPGAPKVCDGPAREMVRLALFGLPGQGRPHETKHREAAFQQLSAQILRETTDEHTLSAAGNRALASADASADPILAGMLRSFVAEQEYLLRQNARFEHPEQSEDDSKLTHAFDVKKSAPPPTRPEIRAAFAHFEHDLDAYVARFEEDAARQTLDKMWEFQRRYPIHIEAETVHQYEDTIDRLRKRRELYQTQVDHLAAQAAQAAARGQQKRATWMVRRLEAITHLLPNVLSTEHLDEIRGLVGRRRAEHDQKECTRELLQRERNVAREVRALAGVIHRYHELAEAGARNTDSFRRAEQNYRKAVRILRARDTEWLTGLLLELETMIDDLDDPDGQARAQVDRFIESVRVALGRLHREIREIQAAASDRPSA